MENSGGGERKRLSVTEGKIRVREVLAWDGLISLKIWEILLQELIQNDS